MVQSSSRRSRIKVALGASMAALVGVGALATVGFSPTAAPAAPLAGPISIGNLVWDDLNNNGATDAGELGLSGVTVDLFAATADGHRTGPVLATTSTDGNGHYVFSGLAAQMYAVRIVPPAGYSSSTGRSGNTTFSYENADPASIVDNVDHGSRVGAEVITYDGVNVLDTIAGGAPIDETDADPSGTANADSYFQIDFGLFKPLSIGNRVFLDADGDGLLTANDGASPGLANVDVCLFPASADPFHDVPLVVVRTDAQGRYRFQAVGEGDYLVVVTKGNVPAGATSSPDIATSGDPNNKTDGDDNGLDASETPNRVVSGVLHMTHGNAMTGEADQSNDPSTPDADSALDIDFGFVPAGGPTVTTTTTTTTTSTTTTAPPTTTAPTTTAPTTVPTTTTAPTTVPTSTTAPTTAPTTVPAATTAPTTAPAATTTIAPATLALGNLVWNDVNNDGRHNAGEPGLAQVAVALYADANKDGIADGAASQATFTNADGEYLFTGLSAGAYIVGLSAPEGYISSTGAIAFLGGPFEPGKPDGYPRDGADHGTGSTTIRSGTINLASGTEPVAAVEVEGGLHDASPDSNADLTVDFGLFKPLSIGNRVWLDKNASGTLDSGDGANPGIAGVSVCLFDSAGLLDTQITDDAGRYLFRNLIPGTYRLVIVRNTLPSGYVLSSTVATSNDPNNHVDNDNNAVLEGGGTYDANPVTISMSTAPTGESDASTDPNADNRSDLTVDFGLRAPTPRGNASGLTVPSSLPVDEPIVLPVIAGPAPAATTPPTTAPPTTATTSAATSAATESSTPSTTAASGTVTTVASDSATTVASGTPTTAAASTPSSNAAASTPSSTSPAGDSAPSTTVKFDATAAATTPSTAPTTTALPTTALPTTSTTAPTTSSAPSTTVSEAAAGSTTTTPSGVPTTTVPSKTTSTIASPTGTPSGLGTPASSDATPTSDATPRSGQVTTACETLWVDWNGDGIADKDEPALAGVTVRLTGNGADVKATTDAQGQYCLTVAEGDYEIEIVAGLAKEFASLGGKPARVQVRGIEISRGGDMSGANPSDSTPTTDSSGSGSNPLALTGAQTGRQVALAGLVGLFGLGLFVIARKRGHHIRSKTADSQG